MILVQIVPVSRPVFLGFSDFFTFFVHIFGLCHLQNNDVISTILLQCHLQTHNCAKVSFTRGILLTLGQNYLRILPFLTLAKMSRTNFKGVVRSWLSKFAQLWYVYKATVVHNNSLSKVVHSKHESAISVRKLAHLQKSKIKKNLFLGMGLDTRF